MQGVTEMSRRFSNYHLFGSSELKKVNLNMGTCARGTGSSISLMGWIGAHRAFAVEIGECVIAKKRAFRVHFILHRNDTVSDRIYNPL